MVESVGEGIMTVHKQYYLTCNICGEIHEERGETGDCVRDEAIDDGWTVVGREKVDEDEVEDFCPDCTERKNNN